MKYRVHRHMAEEIRRRCENRLPIRLNAWWFSLGNIYPDCSHQRIFHMHEPDSAGLMVERMIRRNCRWGLGKRPPKRRCSPAGVRGAWALSATMCVISCVMYIQAILRGTSENTVSMKPCRVCVLLGMKPLPRAVPILTAPLSGGERQRVVPAAAPGTEGAGCRFLFPCGRLVVWGGGGCRTGHFHAAYQHEPGRKPPAGGTICPSSAFAIWQREFFKAYEWIACRKVSVPWAGERGRTLTYEQR